MAETFSPAKRLVRVLPPLFLVASAALILLPAVTNIPAPQAFTAGLCLFAIGYWATGALPAHIVTLILVLMSILLSIAPATVIFAGFHSTAFWLVFSGLVIGVALDRTGLANRIAHNLTKLAGTSYPRLIVVMGFMGLLIAYLIPSSMGRIILLVPIALAVADRMGFAPGRNGRYALVLVIAASTCMPGYAILPANVINMVLIGATETLYGLHFTYSQYLTMLYPLIGLTQGLAIIAIALLVFPDRSEPRAAEAEEIGPMSRGEALLLAILVAMLALWMTDSWHGVSPAWVGMTGAVICLLPPVGLVTAEDFSQKINYGALFFVVGLICVIGIIGHSGLGDIIGRHFVEIAGLGKGEPARNYGILAGTNAVLSLLASPGSVPAIMSPLAATISGATGISILTVQMLQIVGMSMNFLPYQVPQVMVGMQIGGVPLGIGTRFISALGLFMLLVVVPLNYFWWRLLGVL